MPILLFLLLLTACGPKEPVSAGRAYYLQSNCRTCHQINGEGKIAGPDLTFVGFRHDKEWLEKWMKFPRAVKPDTTMPDPRFTPDVRAAVVEYLSGLKGEALRETDGKALYRLAGCSGCHGPSGRGGYPDVPVLAKTASTYTKDELIHKMRMGVKTGKELDMPAWGAKLSDAQLAALADYLLTFKPTGPVDSSW